MAPSKLKSKPESNNRHLCLIPLIRMSPMDKRTSRLRARPTLSTLFTTVLQNSLYIADMPHFITVHRKAPHVTVRQCNTLHCCTVKLMKCHFCSLQIKSIQKENEGSVWGGKKRITTQKANIRRRRTNLVHYCITL